MIDWNKRLATRGVRLVVSVRTPTGSLERPATLRDARDLLQASGMDITSSEAVEWGTPYPAEASNLTRICLLQQRIADLRHRLRGSRLRRV